MQFQNSTGFFFYSVGSRDVLQAYKACRSLRSWASKNLVRTCSSCTSMIRFRCLDKYVNTKFLADLDLLINALALQMAGGLWGAQPPPSEKHGQTSEHTGFLTVHNLFCFASCLHYEIAGGLGGAQPPAICKTWTRIRTHISSCTPLMDVCCSVFCDVAMCLICEIIVICSMLTLPSGAVLEFETFLRSFLRALDALTYDIRNIPCSANMRNFSRTADIGICNFLGFSQGQNAVIDSLRSISKTAYVVICISPSFSKAPHAASCQLLAVFVTFQEPQPKTSGPRDQRTRGPGDQRTRGPEDEGTRAPGAQSRVYGTKGPGGQL